MTVLYPNLCYNACCYNGTALYRPLVLECAPKKCFLFLNQNIYVVGPQKNRLNETVLLSTQNIMLQFMDKKILSFFVIIFMLTIFP